MFLLHVQYQLTREQFIAVRISKRLSNHENMGNYTDS